MYAVIDIETTGGFAQRNRITEIAIYVFDGNKIVDEFSSLVNPEREIPNYISLLTGINNDMVASAPSFKEIAPIIEELTKDKVFVAHNAGFDYSFIRKEFRELGVNYVRKKLCTVRLSRKIIPGLHSYGLGTLCATLGIPIQHRHRAFGDARATVTLLNHLIAHDKEQHIEHALNRLSKEGTLPPNLNADDFNNLPEDVGVYYFLNKKGEVIYVGKAKNIRQRILGHFASFGRSQRSMEFRHQITNITFQLCGNELIAYLLESHEIKKYWPRFNRSQRFTRACWGIYKYSDRAGYLRFTVARTQAMEAPLISFRNFDQAWEFLRHQVEAHGLCKRLSNIQRLTGNCTDYETGSCQGACIAEEPVTSYNQRVSESIKNFNHLNNSFLLLGKGRTHQETSLVWVENGSCKGFGFADDSLQQGDIYDLTACVQRYRDNQDIQRIIGGHLRVNFRCKMIKL